MYIKEIIILFTIFIGLLFTYFNLLVLYFQENRRKKEWKEWPTVSIIVPAYNEERNIEDTLTSLLNLDYDKEKLEIIVVDDGSTDNTYKIAKRYEGGIVKVYKKKNGGKASALNFGIRRAKGEFIVTMDADSVVPRNALKQMLKYFDEEKTMIVIPAIQITEVKSIWEHLQNVEYSYNNFLRLIFDALNSIYVAPGPFSIYRKEFFEKVGYFDEQNITEDMEIAMRCQAYGYKIRYCPEVVVKTKAPKKLVSLIRQRIRWYLGFIDNFLVYRDKILNKVLVNLVFGGAILFIVIPIFSLSIFVYDIAKWLYNTYFFYSSINYNVFPVVKQSLLSWQVGLSYAKIEYLSRGIFYLFYNLVLISCFFIFLREAWKFEENNSLLQKVQSIFFYSILYIFFYAVVWIIVMFYKLFGKELKWGGIAWNNSLLNKLWK